MHRLCYSCIGCASRIDCVSCIGCSSCIDSCVGCIGCVSCIDYKLIVLVVKVVLYNYSCIDRLCIHTYVALVVKLVLVA